MDISSFIAQGEEKIQAMRQDSMDGEKKAFDIVLAATKQWEQQAAVTQKLNRALEYLHTPEVKHTANEWRKTDNWKNDEEISNRVYRMTGGIWEDTKYDRETKQSVPVAWYVTWDVYVNSPKEGYGEKIAGQNQKRYTDKAAAEKYLEGRKKAYSHLFTEISPQIPKQYEHHFTVYGALLPGYTVEGQEPVKQTIPPPMFRRAAFLCLKSRKNLLCWESCLRRRNGKRLRQNRRRQITAIGSTTSSAGGLDKPLRGLLCFRLKAV
ncbi:hypothetical protein C823_004956 [Eubacterium plexicaudatum ASF492]|nr:hypothetical protein C823_004956 [Eubacterium plexicaudatum ASF492]